MCARCSTGSVAGVAVGRQGQRHVEFAIVHGGGKRNERNCGDAQDEAGYDGTPTEPRSPTTVEREETRPGRNGREGYGYDEGQDREQSKSRLTSRRFDSRKQAVERREGAHSAR